MEFEKVVAGIVKYLNKNIFPVLNDWQTVLARTAVSRVLRNAGELKTRLFSNEFLQTYGFVDTAGNVDVDGLVEDLKLQIRNCPEEKISIAIPLFGKYTFSAADIDDLHRMIKEG